MAKRGPPSFPWFRVYVELMQDHKLKRAPVATRWTWVAVLSLARKSPEAGRLLLSEGLPVTLREVADEANVSLRAAQSAVDHFIDRRMLHVEAGVWVVTKWDARQFASDNPTPRVKRFRDKERNVSLTANETPPDTEADTDTEEQETTSLVEPPAPRSLVPVPKQSQGVPKPHQAMIAALGEALGVPRTKGDWSKYATAAADLVKAGALPGDVPGLVLKWDELFTGATCTPFALSNNYASLTSGRKPANGRAIRSIDRDEPRGFAGIREAFADLRQEGA